MARVYQILSLARLFLGLRLLDHLIGDRRFAKELTATMLGDTAGVAAVVSLIEKETRIHRWTSRGTTE